MRDKAAEPTAGQKAGQPTPCRGCCTDLMARKKAATMRKSGRTDLAIAAIGIRIRRLNTTKVSRADKR